MSPGTHIKLLVNRLCIRTQTEEKEHPHCCSPPSFTPLMLHARRRSKGGGQTMETWMRAHSVSCPPLFSDEVAQFMFALYRLCLPHVLSVPSNSLRSLCPFSTPHRTDAPPAHLRHRRGHLTPFFQKKLHWIPALLLPVLRCSASPLLSHRCVSCHAWQWITWLINYIFFIRVKSRIRSALAKLARYSLGSVSTH